MIIPINDRIQCNGPLCRLWMEVVQRSPSSVFQLKGMSSCRRLGSGFIIALDEHSQEGFFFTLKYIIQLGPLNGHMLTKNGGL